MYNRSNYHLLGGTLRQCVPIAEIVDVDVSDVVTTSKVGIGIQFDCFCTRRRAGFHSRTRALWEGAQISYKERKKS